MYVLSQLNRWSRNIFAVSKGNLFALSFALNVVIIDNVADCNVP